MGKTIKVGMIGCGGISALHFGGIAKVEDAEVVALCDTNTAKAEARREQFALKAEICTDYADVLANPEIDVVHIATPHYLHGEMALAAMEAGKWVVLEKPLCIHKREGLELIRRDTQGKLGIVFQNRYNRSTVECKRLLDSGELGKILGAKVQVTWKRDAAYYASADWRGRWDTEGGGTLINQAIHTIDLMYYLCGPFASIKGAVSQGLLSDVIEVEDNAHGVIRFESGMTGLVYASNNYCTDDNNLVIHCEKGTLMLQGHRLYLFQGDDVSILVKRESAPEPGKAAYGNGHAQLIPDFYNCVRSGRPFWINAREAYPAAWVTLSLRESTLSGKWIPYETEMKY